jgi:hypothetical protein
MAGAPTGDKTYRLIWIRKLPDTSAVHQLLTGSGIEELMIIYLHTNIPLTFNPRRTRGTRILPKCTTRNTADVTGKVAKYISLNCRHTVSIYGKTGFT